MSGEYVLICRGLATLGVGPVPELNGQYLESYDPDAHAGRGSAQWTFDSAEAMRFDSFIEAMECWRQTSTVRPIRDDGRPNRPLTAFHVEPTRLP